MSRNEARRYLICYDIANPKRLGRVYRYLKKHAVAVQYSVVMGLMSEGELERVMGGVERLIREGEDDVRAYPIPLACEGVTLGRQYLPEGVILADGKVGELLKGGEVGLRGTGSRWPRKIESVN